MQVIHRTSPSPPHIGIVANCMLAIYNFRIDLIRQLREEGYRVTVIGPRDAYTHLLLREGVHVLPLPLSTYSRNPLADLRATWQLYRLYRRSGLDFIFHYTIKPNTLGTLAARMAGIPSIAVVTGTGNLFFERNHLVRRIMFALYRWTSPLAREVWFLNPKNLQDFRAGGLLPRDNHRLIQGEGVNMAHYPLTPARPADGRTVFLFVGRLITEKGIREFIAVARRIRAEFPEAQFQVLGHLVPTHPSSIATAELEEWIARGHISYLGGCSDPRPHLAAADCVVLPSYSEGKSRVLMEAASMGRPIITTRVPGCQEIVLHGRSGWLVAPKEVSGLAQACRDFLLTAPEDRFLMGQMGHRHIRQHFEMAITLDIYRQCLRQYFPRPAARAVPPTAVALFAESSRN